LQQEKWQKMTIRKLRLEKGWSQEQLAEMAGVSSRTIQRIENGYEVSIETIKCLAAVFEIDFNYLRQENNMSDDILSIEERDAIRYVRGVKLFYTHAMVYACVMGFLFILNFVTGPNYLWAAWPAAGWGILVAIHGLSVFGVVPLFSQDWEKRQIEKRLSKKN